MTNEQALEVFRDAGALLDGHFRLSSGLHSGEYLEKFRLVENPAVLDPLCASLAEKARGLGAEVVMGPTTAGIILAYNVARELQLPARYAERDGEGRALRRGQILAPGTRVLVVDDILTTGKAVHECFDVAAAHGAHVVGVGVLGDRSGGAVDPGCPLVAVLTVAAKAWDPAACPLCAAGVPITQPGTRQFTATGV